MSRPHPFLSWLLAPRGLDDVQRVRQALAGRRVLLTGASYGIGEALALQLGEAGASVVLAARTTARLEDVAARITAAGGRAEVVPLDLMDPRQVADVGARLAKEDLDVVIHNAGKSIRRALEASLDRGHDFQRTMAVNYLGPVQLQLALLPGMLARGRGHLINVSSVGVRLPAAPRWSAYLASKTAFDTWFSAAAPELAARGLACTSIYFGLVHTRMSSPTPAYRTSPGQLPEEAARVVCRALVDRPRRIAPWWVGPLRWLAVPFEGAVDLVQARLFPRGEDSPAARGVDRVDP